MSARQGRPLFRAILSVSPAPDSLVYTSPIFRRLRSFGEVVSFKKAVESAATQGHARASQQLYQVAFAEQSDLYSALGASPFTVDVDHNVPSPSSLDPYNVFGLQQRKHPDPRTFTCQLSREGSEEHFYTSSVGPDEGSEVPLKTRLVKDEKTGPLYKSLLEAGVPLGQLEGLATSRVPMDDDTNSSDAKSLPGLPKLMDLYRSATTRFKHWQPNPADEALGNGREGKVPIRKQYTRKPTKPFRY